MKEQEFTDLVQRVLDGEASEAEKSAMNSLLEEDSEWQKQFEYLKNAHYLLDRLAIVGKKNKRLRKKTCKINFYYSPANRRRHQRGRRNQVGYLSTCRRRTQGSCKVP